MSNPETTLTGGDNVVRLCAPMQDADLVAMIRRNGTLDTVDVANRLGLGMDEARKWLRRVEATGAIASNAGRYSWGVGPGGPVLVWRCADAR